MKYKIKGKIYKFVEECEVIDHEFVVFKKIIENSKGERFYLLHAKYTNDYHLYTLNNKRVLSVSQLSMIG